MMTQRKQKPKMLALSTLPFLCKLIPIRRSDARPATLLEYITIYRRNSVWLAILCTAGASVLTLLLSTTFNDWLWIWPSLTILLIISEIVRASQTIIPSTVYPWVGVFRSYALTYDLAIKVWNAGLKYAMDEALDTNSIEQLIKKYWELQFARRYLAESIDKAVRGEMQADDLEKLATYMMYFKENCVQQ
jgi:hypothetical protein